jgi:hypothetical protein
MVKDDIVLTIHFLSGEGVIPVSPRTAMALFFG